MSSAEYGYAVPRVYLNGQIIPRGRARIEPFDRGFLYGDGFFETTRVYRGRAVFLDRHLERLSSSCRATGFGPGPDVKKLRAGIKRLIRANGIRDGYLRVTVSRGLHRGTLTDLGASEPTVFVEARAMKLPPLDAPSPLTLARSPHRRNEGSPLVRHKSLSYQLNVLALAEGRRRGADEVYFLNSRGRLTEGAVSSLFWVSGGVVRTADVACGLLPGITRQVVLDLCAEHGVRVDVGEFAEEELTAADEVFCTNSLRGIMAVQKLLEAPEKELASFGFVSRLQNTYAAHVARACGPRA
jgi:branched-subunit amino acid aminotransferase/4-amino-4-deoxychorismate lyase